MKIARGLLEELIAHVLEDPANEICGVVAVDAAGPAAEAKRVAGTLLPDVLTYDPTRPASFPDNGRTLTDDAFDSFIRILTNGKVTEDKVGAHGDLLADFPYVGPPHRGVSNGRA